MSKYESSIKQIPFPQGNVYAKLSDLTNLEVVKEKLSDPEAIERIKESGKVSDEQLEKARKQLDTLEFTADTIAVDVPPMGKVSIRIVERQPDKCIKFESVSSPIPLTFWIQLLPISDTASKMKLTLDATMNPFVKMMADKPLKQGIEKLADMLAVIPYNG